MKIYTYDQVFQASLEYFNGDELAAKVFTDKYALRDGGDNFVELTPDDMHDRLAREFARIDAEKYKLDYDERFNIYREAMNKFARIVCQGSPMSSIGNKYQTMSASNCVVVESPVDDIGGILDCAKNLAQLYKRRCGVGVDISTLRPEGMKVSNAARTTSGAWSFADLFSFITRMIGMGSRRGALMITLDVHHPDVIKFATMKHDLTKVTGANISIRLSDKFLKAVEDNTEYEQRWPLEGEPRINKMVKAREVWDIIIDSATNMSEPGLIMWNTMINNLPAHCYPEFKTISTNPCSEIGLSAFDSCRLISINLTGYVKNAFTKHAIFDFNKFSIDIATAQQMADNLVDLELELINRIKAKCEPGSERELWNKLYNAGEKGRRTGLGTHGLADTLAQLCIRYDSQESIEIIDKIYKMLRDSAYDTSTELARVRGSFPVYDWEIEKNCAFIKRLPNRIKDKMKKVGRRNISLLTQAPTGSISILSKVGLFNRFNVSSGVEPVFRNSYTRRKKINYDDKASRTDFIDIVGDKWQEFEVFHSNVQNYLEAHKITDINKLPNYFITSDKIDWSKRVELQGVEQQYLDHSISSCLSENNHLVHTSNGLSYIEDLISNKIDEKQFSPLTTENTYTINHEGVTTEINEGYYNGTSECMKIDFGAERNIIGTSNHKLLTVNHNYTFVWKKLSDIKMHDYIVGRIGLECFGDSGAYFATKLGKFVTNVAHNAKKIKLPKRMSKDLARLLGYLISDGCISKNGIGLSQIRNNVVDDFIDIVYKEFGLKCHIQKDKRAKSDLLMVSTHSRILRDFIKYLGINPGDKRVPRAIFSCAGRRQTAEFIKGLTLDGFVSDSKIGVLTTVNYRLGKEVQLLLEQFGIDAGMVESNEENTLRSFPNDNSSLCKRAWCVYCGLNESQKFIELIGFAEDRKMTEISTKLRYPARKSLVGGCPNFGLRKKFREEQLPNIRSGKLYDIFCSMSHPSKDDMELTRDSLCAMQDMGFKIPSHLLDETYVFRKVKNIQSAGTHKTFDLHIKQSNSYLVNGIISHNTINLPKGTSSEIVGSIYLESWKKGLKGVTVYVDGSRDGVLITKDDKKNNQSTNSRPTIIQQNLAPKRPDTMLCEVKKVKVQGDAWTIFVGLLDGRPYEVFGGLSKYVDIPNKYKTGRIIKNGKVDGICTYNLIVGEGDDQMIIKDIANVFENKNHGPVTRSVSLSLRHGVPLEYIVEQLQKDKYSEMTSFSKVLSRVLKGYVKNGTASASEKKCPSCGMDNTIIYQEGCLLCKNCSFSKCS